MESLKKNKTLLWGLLGASIAAIAGVVLYQKKKTKKIIDENGNEVSVTASDVSQNTSQISTSGVIQDESNEPKRLATKQSALVEITRHQDGIHLSKRTVVGLFKIIFDRTKAVMVPRLRKDRADRREVLNDTDRYLEAYMKSMEAHETAVMGVMEEVCEENGITAQEYNESFEKLLTEGHQDLMMMASAMPQMMKQSLVATKQLTVEEVKDVLRYQVEVAEDEVRKSQESQAMMMMMMQMPGLVFELVATRISDLVYEKFGSEEEDLTDGIKKNGLQNDQEVRMYMEKFVQLLMPLMPQDPGMMMGGGGGGGFGGY